jgi:hypothetical protein
MRRNDATGKYAGWGAGRRVAIAGYASICFNGLLIVLDSSHNSWTSSPSIIGKILDALVRPAGAFTQWIAPGHDIIQILVLLLSSFVFYWVVALVALGLVSVALRLHRIR